eukprot:5634832-Prymnesium_polylepis.1
MLGARSRSCETRARSASRVAASVSAPTSSTIARSSWTCVVVIGEMAEAARSRRRRSSCGRSSGHVRGSCAGAVCGHR